MSGHVKLVVALAVALALGVGIGGVAMGRPMPQRPTAVPAPADVATATAELGDLVSRREFVGTVSHGTAWRLPIQRTGIVTDAPQVGDLLVPGEPIMRIDNAPIFLAEGSLPLYRPLSLAADRKNGLRGEDVAQLQRFLIASKAKGTAGLVADGVFGKGTRDAVRAWQRSVGLPRSGSIDAGQVIFAPGPLLVSAVDRVGASFTALEVTDDTATVTVPVRSKDRLLLPEGGSVVILAGSQTHEGAVATVRTTSDADGQRSTIATVIVDGELPPGIDDVTVLAERVLATDAVLVPVSALIALAGGGYAVEVGAQQTLTRVEIGAVHDGRVEILAGLHAGHEVVIAS